MRYYLLLALLLGFARQFFEQTPRSSPDRVGIELRWHPDHHVLHVARGCSSELALRR